MFSQLNMASTYDVKVLNKGEPLYAGPNGEKVVPPELDVDDPPSWILWFCGAVDVLKICGLPVHTKKPSGNVEKEVLDRLQGYWKIQPRHLAGRKFVVYTDVHVEGDICTISGGMRNRYTPSNGHNAKTHPFSCR